MQNGLFRKGLVCGIFILFFGMSIVPSTGMIVDIDDIEAARTSYFEGFEVFNGSLSGYVNDTDMNPIEGARVRVYFHGTYEENYSDSSGYYHVTNIPICWCMKNATCSKEGYKTEWVLLVITENTTYDFVLYPLEPYPVFNGTMGDNGWWVSPVTVSFVFDPEEVAEIWYNYNGWHLYTEPFVVDKEGEIPIDYYWVNYEGEQSPIATFYLDIDQTPPETNLTWEVYRDGCKWYVKFILTAEDALSGMAPWLLFYINDVLLGEFEVLTWPTVEFEIQWSKSFKSFSFKFECFDMAGNSAFELVNGSDIKSYPSSQSSSQQSANLQSVLSKFLQRRFGYSTDMSNTQRMLR